MRAGLICDHCVNLGIQPIVIDTAESKRSAIVRLHGSLSKRLADAGVKWSKVGACKSIFRTGEVGYLLEKKILNDDKKHSNFD